MPDWATAAQAEVINTYDNAVRYNDHVVSTLIERFSATQAPVFWSIFSDHGEDVYDSPGHGILGRNEGKPTPPMYTIPFLVWTAPAWRARDQRDFRPTLSGPTAPRTSSHTWADLAGLSFDGFVPDKSLAIRSSSSVRCSSAIRVAPGFDRSAPHDGVGRPGSAQALRRIVKR